MIFRRKENTSILNLNAEEVQARPITADSFTSTTGNLSIEDRVKQYFEKLREPVFRYLTATYGASTQAEEITQETFLELYRSLSAGQAIQNVRSWVFRTAHNLAVDQIKSRQFITPLDDEKWTQLQGTLADKCLNPEQTLLHKEKLDRLRTSIGRLTMIERECLNLRTKGFRYREIGEILEIGTTTVSDTLARVIEKLARETNGEHNSKF